MADPIGMPVKIVSAGITAGIGVTQIPVGEKRGISMTVSTSHVGIPIVLVASGGIPATITTEDGNEYVP